MYGRQTGFTLVEIAIVLVIIGLLLGGVLKGQELINSAKVKNLANDFRNVEMFIYGYQDKYRALPGDQPQSALDGQFPPANTASACTPIAAGHCATGNGVIDGTWDADTIADETFVFWQHVRLAGLATGSTAPASNKYRPSNAEGGFIGIESGNAHYILNSDGAFFLRGTYVICSTGILGKFAKQLDTMMDDGDTQTGAMRTVATAHVRGQAALAMSSVDDAGSYTVCMGL